MAKRTVTVCDKCGKDADPAHRFRVTVRGVDPWGGDLCDDCVALLQEGFPGSESPHAPRKRTFEKVIDLDGLG